MSLLDNGPDTITVWVDEEVTDARGNIIRRPSATPVVVDNCRVQPVSSDDQPADGQQVATRYRVIKRDLPGGPWSRVEWDGREWDYVGEGGLHNGSPRTRHRTVLIEARKAADVGVV